jgi:hypothetical protein
MSSATELMSTLNRPVIAAASASSARPSCSRLTVCIASQNRRWPSTEAGILVNRSAAVVFHQRSNASFEHGAASRFSAASAR